MKIPIQRLYPLVLALVLLGKVVSANAAEVPFTQKTFEELRGAGQPVVLHVYAVWCTICKAQEQIVTPLLSTQEFKPLTLLKADFDREKDLLKALNVSDRSTFVAFKSGREVGRSTGDLNKESITALLRSAL
jgi:thioredoxin 1